ncbi:uncharacterized protein LOC107401814 isoform X5 [Peromyscus maniculatus bairdii]|uniref:uncharacterized protein LOC107401814 isoform X5 n=1 Tax=Peromyscus maniculatus bairdii TaxID=230844 RepID=UPI003FD425FE
MVANEMRGSSRGHSPPPCSPLPTSRSKDPRIRWGRASYGDKQISHLHLVPGERPAAPLEPRALERTRHSRLLPINTTEHKPAPRGLLEQEPKRVCGSPHHSQTQPGHCNPRASLWTAPS